MVQYIFEKRTETPSRGDISCCSNILDLKKDMLYHLLAMIGQWYNKDVHVTDDDNKMITKLLDSQSFSMVWKFISAASILCNRWFASKIKSERFNRLSRIRYMTDD